jgi:hypothetical protein
MSILNLSEDWLEMMDEETRDHREMDNMMDVTGAVLDVEMEMMDVLMKTLGTALEAMNIEHH